MTRILDGKFIFSDFGLAITIVGGDQIGVNTNTVVEYVIDVLLHVKFDVFNFIILVLEVISGMKNKGFHHANHSQNLIGHAWKLWNEGRPLELIDTCLASSCTLSKALCGHPENRPNMASVVIMLGSEIAMAHPKHLALPALNFSFVSNEDEVYMIFQMVNESLLGRMIMNQTISFRQQWIWSQAEQNWTLYGSFPRDPCDSYGHCGGNGNCVLGSSPICQCLERFVPASPEKWKLNDFSEGCVRGKPLSCKNDGFAKYHGLKLPDTTHSWTNKNMNLDDCRAKCLSNCSCSAYTNFDVRGGGSGCAIWFGDLVDIKQIPGGDEDIYIKISASELGGKDEKWKIGVIAASAFAVIVGMLFLGYCYILRFRAKKYLKVYKP
ncbi:hypothetical protein DVH24_003508 [Malus domestica]|uniref:non-specific serine/threonine protein kinase n=1 Tax=Malus domestica TaxID=3750 RepID=A0A498III0_MALDO|nr:hypothetical protein DVH24_003508 [Malus domestica]